MTAMTYGIEMEMGSLLIWWQEKFPFVLGQFVSLQKSELTAQLLRPMMIGGRQQLYALVKDI